MSDLVVPTGAWALPIEHLRDMLAECPAWQAWVSTSDASLAKLRTYAIDLPPPEKGPDRAYTPSELEALRPYAVVDTVDFGGAGLRFSKYAESAFTQAGELLLTFDDNVSPTDAFDPAAAKLRFMAMASAVVEGLLDLAGVDGRLNVTNVSVLEGPVRSSVEELPTFGDRFLCYIRISYGV